MNNCLIDDRRIKVGHASAFCMCRVTEDPLAVQCSRLVAASMWRAPWQPTCRIKCTSVHACSMRARVASIPPVCQLQFRARGLNLSLNACSYTKSCPAG